MKFVRLIDAASRHSRLGCYCRDILGQLYLFELQLCIVELTEFL